MAQAQTQEQLIRLYKTRKSYVYKGKYYTLNNKMYICENAAAFTESYNNSFHKQQYILLEIKRHITLRSSFILREYDIMLIKEMVKMVIICNRNYDKLFKHIGLRYNILLSTNKKPFMYALLKKAKYLLHLLSTSDCQLLLNNPLHNQGIRETNLFIAMMTKHFAYHRTKMVNYLPRLLGHRIDDNVATIIYEYCI
jgi:hypothetical protein